MILLSLFSQKTRILFVCTENICRSPLAEGLLRHHLKLDGASGAISVDSAGTLASQPGARPDQRVVRVAAEAGVALGRISARRVTEKDLFSSDLVLVMERKNFVSLLKICPHGHESKIRFLLDFDPEQDLEDVPDPYYGNYQGFQEVLHIIEGAIRCLVPQIGKTKA